MIGKKNMEQDNTKREGGRSCLRSFVANTCYMVTQVGGSAGWWDNAPRGGGAQICMAGQEGRAGHQPDPFGLEPSLTPEIQ